MDETEAKVTSEDVTDSSEGDDAESEPELMVTTRAKRATAGNRYSTLVAQEEAVNDEEDDVALLFAEDGEEEDEEYNSDEGADEADMSSSDDDDDQGPAAGAEDLEGEKEIQKEAKAERTKKRKADMALTSIAGLKKKPKIDPTSLRRATVLKPSKRKERVSWLPEQGNMSARPSLRAQTIAHRAETHAKLKVNEAQRLKMKAIREKREREREADAPKELTQADRLAEAERIERKNAKSLNRWETMEKKRAEEQAAKLAALKERKLSGAVVTLYSSAHKYNGLKDDRDTASEVPAEGKKRGRKPKAFHEQMAAARLAEGAGPIFAPASSTVSASVDTVQTPSASNPVSSAPVATDVPTVLPVTHGPNDFLTGIHEFASMNSEKPQQMVSTVEAPKPATNQAPVEAESIPVDDAAVPSKQEVVQPSATLDTKTSLPTINPVPSIPVPSQGPDAVMVDAQVESNSPLTPQLQDPEKPPLVNHDDSGISLKPRNPMPITHPNTVNLTTSGPPSDSGASPALSVPQIEVTSTRNLVILDKVEDLTGQMRNDFGLFFNNRKTTKPAKHTPELCLITGLPARYKDPATGIGYANATAYKKLQQLKQHQFTWSSMLGCYVGQSRFVARGVPDGFLGT